MKKHAPPAEPQRTQGVGNRPITEARADAAASAATPSFPVLAMAGSVGGLEALSVILGGLPAGIPAAIAIVMHLSPA